MLCLAKYTLKQGLTTLNTFQFLLTVFSFAKSRWLGTAGLIKSLIMNQMLIFVRILIYNRNPFHFLLAISSFSKSCRLWTAGLIKILITNQMLIFLRILINSRAILIFLDSVFRYWVWGGRRDCCYTAP